MAKVKVKSNTNTITYCAECRSSVFGNEAYSAFIQVGKKRLPVIICFECADRRLREIEQRESEQSLKGES